MEREKIISFLEEIGIPVIETQLPDDCFLPGLAIEKNTILMDPAKMNTREICCMRPDILR